MDRTTAERLSRELENIRAHLRFAMESERARFDKVIDGDFARRMTVGKHEAGNYAHLRAVLAEADTECPRAADTIRWLLWRSALSAQTTATIADARSYEEPPHPEHQEAE